MKQTITARLVEPGDFEEGRPASKYPLQRRLMARVAHALGEGGWWCLDCEAHTERVEGEQGQPAHCERCGSHRIQYHAPGQHL